ncbi:MAG: PQQ-binding-like beta-propeller repeat protein, partial [Armatimonadetes bacterium]|nr:PQQ-binding-like beta-propeller repeat protein [Armatimonadota bacterium]
ATVGKVTNTVTIAGVHLSSDSETTLDVWFFETTPEDWPMFMHDPQHTGMSNTWDATAEAMPSQPQWVVDLPTASTSRQTQYDPVWGLWFGGQYVLHPNPAGGNTWIFEHPYIDSSPVVVGKRVIVGTWTRGTTYTNATGSVKSFNAETGSSDSPYGWTATGNPTMGGVASTPCVSDGRVYVGTTNGYLYCLNLTDGSQIWAQPTTDRTGASSKIISSPIVHDGVVYITNEASKVYAFTADNTGTLIAGYPIVLPIDTHGITDVNQQKICGASSPAIATVSSVDYLLVGCDDGYLYRLRLSDRTLSELNMGGCVESSPSISGNNAYVGVSYWNGPNLRRVTIEPFEEVATWYLGEESRATPSLEYDFLYNGIDTGNVFYKVDANALGSSGDYLAKFEVTHWVYTPHYFVGSAAHTTGGIIYTGNDSGRFYALDAHDLHSVFSQEENPYGRLDGYYDVNIAARSYICSSPAIAYNVDANHNRWVFITTRSDGGKLYAFKIVR